MIKRKEVEIMDEHVDPEEVVGYPEPVNVEVILEPLPVPEAEFIFNTDAARQWLDASCYRGHNSLKSIRFDPEGIPIKHITFLFELIREALMKEYQKKYTLEVCKGLLYVPDYLVENPILKEYFEQVDMVGEYVVFQKK